ncbi:MAG: toxin-antitoxin system YwqK family antitoxin [Bacteroidota bacterium]
MKNLFTLFITLVLFSCGEDENKKNTNPLIEMKDGVETIWYPGKTQVKYRREFDSRKRRHGKWVLYNPQGKVMSSSYYENGKKTGVWLVNHPNGQLYYTGEYKNDNKVGIWVFYSITGEKLIENSYDENGKLVKYEKFNLTKSDSTSTKVKKEETGKKK